MPRFAETVGYYELPAALNKGPYYRRLGSSARLGLRVQQSMEFRGHILGFLRFQGRCHHLPGEDIYNDQEELVGLVSPLACAYGGYIA